MHLSEDAFAMYLSHALPPNAETRLSLRLTPFVRYLEQL